MKYTKRITKIYEDIGTIKIQGATNVAIATLEGMKIALDEYNEKKDSIDLFTYIVNVGNYLAYARPNEPLAQNAVLFLAHFFEEKGGKQLPLDQERQLLEELSDEYLQKIADSKKAMIDLSANRLRHIDHVLTHCHSSTAVGLIKEIARDDDDFTVVCTETRPKFQGRITAKSLLDARLATTLIADSAAESFVIGRGSKPVSAVFIGCDAITMDGYCINKIGSWGISMAAHQSSKPLYVVTPLLKIDHDSAYHEIEIEIREDRELWKDAPKGLEMYNPAFEVVDAGLITGFVTEYGILKPREIKDLVKVKYSWLFKDK